MYRFDELKSIDNRKPLIGMKAESLIYMRENGFNVPDGFVITTDEIHSRAVTVGMLAGYADENVEYAVRSSGTSEDLAGSSFAGQYETFLKVKGHENLLAAVEGCARSIHNERVAAYAKRNNIDISESKMAVIVQRMVDSEKSGVAFSIDSINGRDKVILIEAICGLGDKLVSGHVTPDTYAYNWYDEKITGYRAGGGAGRAGVVGDAGGGAGAGGAGAGGGDSGVSADMGDVGAGAGAGDNSGLEAGGGVGIGLGAGSGADVGISVGIASGGSAEAGAGVLTRDEVKKLAETILDIQILYGFPVDVEWAMIGETVHILQSRPITTISYRDIPNEWTTADFRDGGVSSSACKTLMASLYGLVFNHSFLDSLKAIKLLPKNENSPIYDVFFARPYWSLTMEKDCFAKLPGYVEREIDEDMGVVPAYEGDGTVTKINLSSLWSGLNALAAIRKHIKCMERKAGEQSKAFIKQFEAVGHIELSAKATDELHNIWVGFIKNDYFISEYTYFSYIFCNMILSTTLKDKIKKHLPSDMDIMTNLMKGLSDLSHMRPIYEMWDMSRRQYSDAEFYEFINKYKYHSQCELDISYPNWDETPDVARNAIIDFEKLGDTHNPKVLGEKQTQIYHETLINVPKKLHKDIEQMRSFLWWREEFRDISTKSYYLIRKLTLALGNAWERVGVLESADDIFFLSVGDIEDKAVGNALKNKKYYKSFVNFKNPNELGNRHTQRKTLSAGVRAGGAQRGEARAGGARSAETRVGWARSAEARAGGALAGGAQIIKGIPCSGETVTATARVIKDIHDSGRLSQGDILVTQCTDPAWTAVFSKLSGVITETGGMLSHAAVVSREYGLACILLVKNATGAIQDGEIITMDCKTGEIYKRLEDSL